MLLCSLYLTCINKPWSSQIFYLSRMRRQAERWGAELHHEDVEAIDVKTSPFTVQSSERKVIYSSAAILFTI